MVGFIIGTICLLALIKVVRRGRGRGGCGAGRGWRGGWRGRGEGFRHGWMRWLYQTLDTTPGQERVLRDAIDDVRKAAEGPRGELKNARTALAEALAAEIFDEAAVQKAYARVEIEAQQLRDRVVDNLKHVHETLTPDQRKRLSAVISRGMA